MEHCVWYVHICVRLPNQPFRESRCVYTHSAFRYDLPLLRPRGGHRLMYTTRLLSRQGGDQMNIRSQTRPTFLLRKWDRSPGVVDRIRSPDPLWILKDDLGSRTLTKLTRYFSIHFEPSICINLHWVTACHTLEYVHKFKTNTAD